jgi:hypothetical protein
MDWFFENCFIQLFALSILGLFAFIGWGVWFDSTHSCSKWTTPYYHAPTYVMVGKVMVPSGGGTYSDCVEYKAK